ncbi:unnamed protein product [Lampetra fluviatilis]
MRTADTPRQQTTRTGRQTPRRLSPGPVAPFPLSVFTSQLPRIGKTADCPSPAVSAKRRRRSSGGGKELDAQQSSSLESRVRCGMTRHVAQGSPTHLERQARCQGQLVCDAHRPLQARSSQRRDFIPRRLLSEWGGGRGREMVEGGVSGTAPVVFRAPSVVLRSAPFAPLPSPGNAAARASRLARGGRATRRGGFTSLGEKAVDARKI